MILSVITDKKYVYYVCHEYSPEKVRFLHTESSIRISSRYQVSKSQRKLPNCTKKYYFSHYQLSTVFKQQTLRRFIVNRQREGSRIIRLCDAIEDGKNLIISKYFSAVYHTYLTWLTYFSNENNNDHKFPDYCLELFTVFIGALIQRKAYPWEPKWEIFISKQFLVHFLFIPCFKGKRL